MMSEKQRKDIQNTADLSITPHNFKGDSEIFFG
jgi:hypothetical protein